MAKKVLLKGRVTISGTPIVNAQVGTAYAGFTVTGRGGTNPLAYSKAAGPSWLSVNSSSGAVTGMPDDAATTDTTIRVTDARGATADLSFSLVVQASGLPTPLIADQTINFGALTLANAGGAYPVNTGGVITSAAITGGSLSGAGWAIAADGRLTKTSDTVSSGTLACSFTNDQGTDTATITINPVSNTYSASGTTEGAAALAAAIIAGAGKTVRMRPGTYGAWTISSKTFNTTTLAFDDGSTVTGQLLISSVTGLTISDLVIVNPNLALVASITTNAALYILNSTVIVDTPSINCDTGSLTTIELRLIGVGANGSTVTITDGTIVNVGDGIVTNDGSATIQRCHISYFVTDCITGVRNNWVVEDNIGTFSQGWGGKRLLGVTTVSGSVAVGDYISSGSGTNYRGGKIRAIGSGTIDLMYNLHEFPASSDTLTGPNGSIHYTSTSTAYDGPHGDFFQPLLNSATGDHSLTVRRNWAYRTTPPVHGEFTVGSEAFFQGLFCQDNGNAHYFNPVIITHNIIASGQTNGITANKMKNCLIQYNTVVQGPFTGGDGNSGFRFQDCSTGSIINNTGTVVVDNGGETAMTIANNVATTRASYSTNYPGLTGAEPYDSLSDYIPGAGGAVEAASAGALDLAGDYRS